VKRALFAFLLFLASAAAFSQTRQDTLVYVLDLEGGTARERRFFADSLRMEISAAGYALTAAILEADYALSCSLRNDGAGEGRFLLCSLLDAKEEKELASTALLYHAVDEAYELLPYVIWSLFAGAPLKSPPPEKEIVEIEKEVPVYIERVREVERPVPPPPKATVPPDSWKYRRLFLNARAGLSSRFYLAANDTAPSAAIATFDGGVESELYLVDVIALQLGLNYALDRAEYRRSPANPTPLVYATSLLSVPLMVKRLFNPSPLTTLGPYLGAYATFPLLGASAPPPFGLLAGLDLSVKTGLGVLLFDLRCSTDLGATDVADSAIAYRRIFLTLSAGYKFGFAWR
jgi:hypothetical protein